MGSATSFPLVGPPAEVQPIRLIDFADFKEVGEFPRFPDHQNIIRDVSSLDLSDAFIVYISHVWMRSRPSLDNFKDYPRPDSADNEHYKLCVAGIESLLASNQVSLSKCYLWIDCSCLRQRDPSTLSGPKGPIKVDRTKEIDRQIGQIMYMCDCMFTPDTGLADFVRTSAIGDAKKVSDAGHAAYLNRGWCSLEMYYASFIPLSKTSQHKQKYVTRAIAHAFELKRRPHFVYGAKEQTHQKAPLIVPAMRHNSLKMFDPAKGYFTHDEDAKVVRVLFKELAYHYMKSEPLGYKGKTDEKGLRHGHGRYVFPSGGVYEGGYQNGLKHGFGRFEMASGDVVS